MAYWILKQSVQEQYADQPGRRYVYDNRHSIQVRAGDCFVYLDKRFGGYGFTGHGVITRVIESAPRERLPNISCIYTAEIGDYIQYHRILDIRLTSAEGRKNRAFLGVFDANRSGWSRSVAQINAAMFASILELAYQRGCISVMPPSESDYAVLDTWSYVRRRHSLERFKDAIWLRQSCTCAICGTTLSKVLEVAHISKYSIDTNNRANPANGIGLCAYCHKAFDGGVFRLEEDGVVSVPDNLEIDSVALAHLSNLSPEARLRLLEGIDTELLRQRNNT